MHYLFSLIFIFISGNALANNYEHLNWNQITELEFKVANSEIRILNSTQNFSKFTNLKKCASFRIKNISIKNRLGLLETTCFENKTITTLETGYSYLALIATSDIENKSEITNENAAFTKVVTKRKHDLPNLNHRIISRKTLIAGSIISKRVTKKAPDIFEGEIIEIKDNGKNFKIVKKIQALESGFIGEKIRILDKTEKTGTIFLENGATSVKITN